MHPAVSRIKNPVLEVLLFSVSGVRYGVELGQVVGLVRDLPAEGARFEEGQLLLFEGREVPVFPAEDFLHDLGPGGCGSREAIIFDDGRGFYGMAVDATESVREITVGDGLYVFPPQEATDIAPCRAWGLLSLAERPVLLLDMSRVAVH